MDRDWRPPFQVDAPLALSVHRHGGADPTFRVDRHTGEVWRTSLTPDGPASIRVTQPNAQRIIAHAWGPGAGWLLDTLPAQLGANDDPARLATQPARTDPVRTDLADLARRVPGLRIGRSARVLEALIPAVLEQKVVSKEAHRAWNVLLDKFGTPAPGPAPASLRVFPDPKAWLRIPSWDWHRAGVEGVRARTIMNAARLAGRLEQIADADADALLRTLPGIGQWTSAEVRQRAFGDPDAISVGDYNLPKLVGWTLAGQRDIDDRGMLELLAPYAGQRYRVQRLIELGGSAPPRRGPRMPVRDYRSF